MPPPTLSATGLSANPTEAESQILTTPAALRQADPGANRKSPLGQPHITPASQRRSSPLAADGVKVSPVSSEGKSTSPSLRAYRPPGSNDVYYVEQENDDAASVTTLESTHIGKSCCMNFSSGSFVHFS